MRLAARYWGMSHKLLSGLWSTLAPIRFWSRRWPINFWPVDKYGFFFPGHDGWGCRENDYVDPEQGRRWTLQNREVATSVMCYYYLRPGMSDRSSKLAIVPQFNYARLPRQVNTMTESFLQWCPISSSLLAHTLFSRINSSSSLLISLGPLVLCLSSKKKNTRTFDRGVRTRT